LAFRKGAETFGGFISLPDPQSKTLAGSWKAAFAFESACAIGLRTAHGASRRTIAGNVAWISAGIVKTLDPAYRPYVQILDGRGKPAKAFPGSDSACQALPDQAFPIRS
jgi:hypothetical protein